MAEEKQQEQFSGDAKSIVDLMFDNKLFRPDLTRDDLSTLEEYIRFCMSSRLDSLRRIEKLMEKVEARKTN